MDLESTWLQMQREDGSESGTVPVKQSNGEMRLLEVEPPQPEEDAPVASDESDVDLAMAEEATAGDEAAHMEAEAVECGYGD